MIKNICIHKLEKIVFSILPVTRRIGLRIYNHWTLNTFSLSKSFRIFYFSWYQFSSKVFPEAVSSFCVCIYDTNNICLTRLSEMIRKLNPNFQLLECSILNEVITGALNKHIQSTIIIFPPTQYFYAKDFLLIWQRIILKTGF